MNKFDYFQLLLKQAHQNIQFKDTMNAQIESQVPAVLKVVHQVIFTESVIDAT